MFSRSPQPCDAARGLAATLFFLMAEDAGAETGWEMGVAVSTYDANTLVRLGVRLVRCPTCWTPSPAPYSVVKVANRTTRVWHGATENWALNTRQRPHFSRLACSPRYGTGYTRVRGKSAGGVRVSFPPKPLSVRFATCR
jgi:hypothetical protein